VKPFFNPYLRRVAHAVGADDENISLAVQLFVSEKARTSENLEALARNLGVDRIQDEELPYDGGIFREPGGRLVIKLNAYNPFTRRRFTLAHEIAHLLLDSVPGLRSTCREDPALERACDCIAAELLMPSDSATNFIRDLGGAAPEKLSIIAKRFGVSLHVAAIRVRHDLRLWTCCIGSWERYPEVRKLWFVGPRRWDAIEPDSDSFDRALYTDKPVRSRQLWAMGPLTEVWFNLLRSGRTRVLGLMDFLER
jgi:hypothetical protein